MQTKKQREKSQQLLQEGQNSESDQTRLTPLSGGACLVVVLSNALVIIGINLIICHNGPTRGGVCRTQQQVLTFRSSHRQANSHTTDRYNTHIHTHCSRGSGIAKC